MKLEQAKKIANEFVELIRNDCRKIEIVGSIRRQKEDVHDIDILLIPKISIKYPDDAVIKKNGEKLTVLEWKGMRIDVYKTDEKKFDTLKLIRTGSAAQNAMQISKI